MRGDHSFQRGVGYRSAGLSFITLLGMLVIVVQGTGRQGAGERRLGRTLESSSSSSSSSLSRGSSDNPQYHSHTLTINQHEGHLGGKLAAVLDKADLAWCGEDLFSSEEKQGSLIGRGAAAREATESRAGPASAGGARTGNKQLA